MQGEVQHVQNVMDIKLSQDGKMRHIRSQQYYHAGKTNHSHVLVVHLEFLARHVNTYISFALNSHCRCRFLFHKITNSNQDVITYL